MIILIEPLTPDLELQDKARVYKSTCSVLRIAQAQGTGPDTRAADLP
jgi:hypothetical protein